MSKNHIHKWIAIAGFTVEADVEADVDADSFDRFLWVMCEDCEAVKFLTQEESAQ